MSDFHFDTKVILQHPREQVFEFSSRVEYLNLLTPPWVHFSVLTPGPIEMRQGTVIEYRIRLRGVPMRWTSEITEWEPPHRFEDTQIRGPYRKWVHRHIFEETPDGTLARDEVLYQVPGGTVVNRLFVAGELRRIFDYRRARLLELYP